MNLSLLNARIRIRSQVIYLTFIVCDFESLNFLNISIYDFHQIIRLISQYWKLMLYFLKSTRLVKSKKNKV